MTHDTEILEHAEATLRALKEQLNHVSMTLALRRERLREAQEAVSCGEREYNDMAERVQSCQRTIERIKAAIADTARKAG